MFFIFAVLKHVFYFLKPFFSVFYGFLFQNSEIEINGFSCHPQTRNSNEVPNIPHGHMFHGIHRENVYFFALSRSQYFKEDASRSPNSDQNGSKAPCKPPYKLVHQVFGNQVLFHRVAYAQEYIV